MKTIHYILPLSLCLAALFTGCQNDIQEVAPDKTEASAKEDFSSYTGETIRVEFEATLPDAEIEKAPTRAFQYDSFGTMHMDYSNWLGPINVHIALHKRGEENNITYKTVVGNIKMAGQKYILEIDPTNLQLREGFFKDGQWEVCAMIDKRNQILADGQYVGREFNTLKYLDPEGNFEFNKLEVPIYSHYKEVLVTPSINNPNTKRVLLPLDFKPLGTVIKATLENNLYTEVDYTQINIQNANVIAGDLVLDFGKVNGEISAPLIRRKDGSRSRRCSFDFKTRLAAPNNLYKKIYLWCIPIDQADLGNPRFSMYYKLKGSTQKPDSIIYQSPQKLPYGLQNTKYYNLRLRMPESDLMITEFGHLNVRGWNYSWIELFNPTNHDINLWQYGLARVHEWEPNSGYPPNYAIWQSFLQSSHLGCNMDQALIQNLHITNVNNPIYHADGSIYSQSGINRYHTMYMSFDQANKYKGPGGNILKPGKTIVLFAGGTYNYLKTKRDLSDEYWPSKASGFGNYYLSNAVFKGKCQYVIAVDNGKWENNYGGMGDQASDQSGAFQHSVNNGIVLLKREDPNWGEYKTIIDAVAGTVNAELFKSFNSRMPARLIGAKDWWWAGRQENTMYPLGLREPADIKFGTPFNSDSPWASTEPFDFMDWKIFIAPWTQYKYLMSPGTRVHEDRIFNGGNKMPGAWNEH